MKNAAVFACVSMIYSVSCVDLRAANLVVNPGFETGTFTPWVPGGWGINSVDASTLGSFGNDFAYTGCIGGSCVDENLAAQTNFLYQDVATVAGATYTFSFHYRSFASSTNEIKAFFDGGKVADLSNAPAFFPGGSAPFAFFSTTAVASGTTTRIGFIARDDLGDMLLDEVSLVGGGGTAPEPSTWFLIGSSVAVLCVLRRHNR